MTRRTIARVAGFTFLFYIAVGLTSMILFGRATAGSGTASQLANIAAHATDVRLTIVLDLLSNMSALVLGVTLYAITRDHDPTLALLAMVCRVAEGISGSGADRPLGLLWLAAPSGTAAADPRTTQALGAFFLRPETFGPAAFFFAAGSTIFCWLFLRGRMIPAALAWLGVIASVLVVVAFPLQLAGLLGHAGFFAALTRLMWLPMLVFEVTLAFWLIVKGVRGVPGAAAPPAAVPPL